MPLTFDQKYEYDGTLAADLSNTINSTNVNGTIALQIAGTSFIYISGSIDQSVELNKRVKITGYVTKPTNRSTATYSATMDDFVIAATSIPGGGMTITLPSNMDDGTQFLIIDVNGGAATNNITIDTEGEEQISGNVSLTISGNYGYARVMAHGSNYFLLDNKLT